MTSSEGQRIDKWLWYARLTKTRSLASKLVAAGKVRINREKITKPAHTVREDDVVTATLNRSLKIVKILSLGTRRGPAAEAQQLYEDLTPKEETEKKSPETASNSEPTPIEPAPAPKRSKGMGRPTKRDRRKIEEFQQKT